MFILQAVSSFVSVLTNLYQKSHAGIAPENAGIRKLLYHRQLAEKSFQA
jgi:hypothetical protein